VCVQPRLHPSGSSFVWNPGARPFVGRRWLLCIVIVHHVGWSRLASLGLWPCGHILVLLMSTMLVLILLSFFSRGGGVCHPNSSFSS
jgi:hypothetical protein